MLTLEESGTHCNPEAWPAALKPWCLPHTPRFVWKLGEFLYTSSHKHKP